MWKHQGCVLKGTVWEQKWSKTAQVLHQRDSTGAQPGRAVAAQASRNQLVSSGDESAVESLSFGRTWVVCLVVQPADSST